MCPTWGGFPGHRKPQIICLVDSDQKTNAIFLQSFSVRFASVLIILDGLLKEDLYNADATTLCLLEKRITIIIFDFMTTSPPTGADLHGERGGGAAADQAHRQPGDADQRVGGLEPPTGQVEEPDRQSSLHEVPVFISPVVSLALGQLPSQVQALT